MKFRRDIVKIKVRNRITGKSEIIEEKYYTVITFEENVGPLKPV